MDPGILIPVTGYGGIERIIEMLAVEYVRKGHEVHLLITDGSKLQGCTVHGFGKQGFPPKKSDARKAIPVVWKFLWRYKNDFDLVHNFGRLLYLLPIPLLSITCQKLFGLYGYGMLFLLLCLSLFYSFLEAQTEN